MAEQGDELDTRIAAARGRLEARDAAKKQRTADGSTTKAVGFALRFSAELVAAVLVGMGLGWLTDQWLGTGPWGLLIGLGIGMAAGMRNIVRAAGQLNREAAAPSAADPGATEQTDQDPRP